MEFQARVPLPGLGMPEDWKWNNLKPWLHWIDCQQTAAVACRDVLQFSHMLRMLLMN
jgi:hypothetical protein